jgi:aminoglycoside phosphotransferase (APT) family kinase protein
VDPEHISAELARDLVKNQFPGWSSLPIRPVSRQGVDNRSFRLGDDLLVRLPAGEWYAHQVDKEQTWLPRLAPQLPLPIPEPVARGAATPSYPYPWSIYRWIEGVTAAEAITDWGQIAQPLARFLAALQRVDPRGGPTPGTHNFFRGASVRVYGDETIAAIQTLGTEIDRAGAESVWSAATASPWTQRPRWFHGDVSADNLLTRNGRLCAVIDFGTSGVGDPACDTVISWTHLDPHSREVFRRVMDLDAATWARGRGWALWKALISLVRQRETGDDAGAAHSRSVIGRVLADHQADAAST